MVIIKIKKGYLISQFLSPISNKRNDNYGGSIENRSKFLREIIELTRKEVGKEFPIGVKINSAGDNNKLTYLDFQKGGFSENDSIYVIIMLEELGVDMVEISGGTYVFYISN
jgi:2,4-dienoyl-CoA reductase-like NADH-dependent reductase (Old Yellow Enzyme family)